MRSHCRKDYWSKSSISVVQCLIHCLFIEIICETESKFLSGFCFYANFFIIVFYFFYFKMSCLIQFVVTICDIF